MTEESKKPVYNPSPFADRRRLENIPFDDFGGSGGPAAGEESAEPKLADTVIRTYENGYAPKLQKRGGFVEAGDHNGEGAVLKTGEIKIIKASKKESVQRS